MLSLTICNDLLAIPYLIQHPDLEDVDVEKCQEERPYLIQYPELEDVASTGKH